MNIFLILAQLIDVVVALIFVRIVISWLNPQAMYMARNPLLRLLRSITDPLLGMVRGLIPPMGMMDFSPMVLLIGLGLLRSVLLMLAVSI